MAPLHSLGHGDQNQVKHFFCTLASFELASCDADCTVNGTIAFIRSTGPTFEYYKLIYIEYKLKESSHMNYEYFK